MSLTSTRMEIAADPIEVIRASIREGWGDGLPIVPATPELVEQYVQASGLAASHLLGKIPPIHGLCTVEKVAVNAVMAGAPPEAMRFICDTVTAMLPPGFDLAGVNATTAAVVPAIVVNGPIRDELGIPYSYSALGGVACSAPAIGRAIRLIMRNIGGMVPGETSESVFGQPGRVTGIVVGEWEERSPWPPLGERRGCPGNSVTIFPALGTMNILDDIAETGQEILEVIGKSLAYMGSNNFMPITAFASQMVAINPIWANEVIARDIPSFEDVRTIVWEHARLPLDWFPAELRPAIERRGHLDSRNRVYLMDTPDDLNLFVCGGLGNLHAAMLPGFSNVQPVTGPVCSE
jgi:hypothetical protein